MWWDEGGGGSWLHPREVLHMESLLMLRLGLNGTEFKASYSVIEDVEPGARVAVLWAEDIKQGFTQIYSPCTLDDSCCLMFMDYFSPTSTRMQNSAMSLISWRNPILVGNIDVLPVPTCVSILVCTIWLLPAMVCLVKPVNFPENLTSFSTLLHSKLLKC